MHNTLTLVSSVFDSPNEDVLLPQLMALKQTHLCIVLYATPSQHRILESLCENSNVLLMPSFELRSLWIHGIYETYKSYLRLPNHRNVKKDTEAYILSRHAKHELLEHAIKTNPWKGTHFVWVDFDTPYRCKNIESVANYLQWLNVCHCRENVLTMAGGWAALVNEADALESPYWRFCGVLMGDAPSILEFCELYKEYLPVFLEKHQKWVWEFNVWAWLEYSCKERWKAVWYSESPDIDELFMWSADYYTRALTPIQKIDYMDYTIPDFYACSSSYIHYQGEHYLNTRFVSYWIAANGYYVFQDGSHTIRNKNVLTKINVDTYSPEAHWEMSENIQGMRTLCAEPISVGLEDIRLFEYRGQIHYIATTIGYTEHGKARMMMGEYDIHRRAIVSGILIEPPEDTFCEKNWIPLIKADNTCSDSSGCEELFFIYKWHPFQIGKIKEEKGGKQILVIVECMEIQNILFRKVRGSTPFIKTDHGLLGVVHFSENHTPRHYYHMLVLLDEETFCVIQYSNTFCFEKLGIEFCIGFSLDANKNYVFWVSRHDRDPCVITASPYTFRWIES